MPATRKGKPPGRTGAGLFVLVAAVGVTWIQQPLRAAPIEGATVTEGEEVFQTQCASCHGPEGQGYIAPPVIGPDAALASYGTARKLHRFISSTMPQNAPGSLSDEQYLDVLAFLLQRNGFIGRNRLTADQLSGIRLQR